MDKADFLSFLVDETFKLQESGESNLSSLEHKLNDYGLDFLKGEFIPQTQMLRFMSPFGTLDVPVNWSIFSLEEAQADHVLLHEQQDTDFFFSVMKQTWNPNFDKLLVTHADGFCYLIGLKAGEDVHVQDLLNPQEWLRTA